MIYLYCKRHVVACTVLLVLSAVPVVIVTAAVVVLMITQAESSVQHVIRPVCPGLSAWIEEARVQSAHLL